MIRLLVVEGKPAGKSLLFPCGPYYLGRGPECNVRFTSEWVSRQHCLLRVHERGSTLRDLGSRNGTLVNGQLVTGEQELLDGQHIQIGPVIFQVKFQEPTGEEHVLPTPEMIHPADHDSAMREPPLGKTDQHPVYP